MFAVVGMGAVGSLLAYFLNGAGVEPYAVSRTRCERYVFCDGGCRELRVRHVGRAPPEVRYSLVAVKGPDTADALSAVSGVPVLFQNGIGGLELARRIFPSAAAAVVTYGVYREGCRAELRGRGEIILPRDAAEVGEALARGGAAVRIVEDVEPYRWAKLVVNAAINPVTAVLQAPNGVLLENAWARALAEKLAGEAASVAAAVGYPVEGAFDAVLQVARATAQNISSMAQDLARCRPTEVDFINGAVVKYGGERGVPTPYNHAVYALVKALEERCSSRSRTT
ncbi:ketopantoate reductase family protein [Pyrobaculum neutrophilum]|uniref:2-dehydropantoate 2-reductase n=1 Tax=Pyrobaculum neutrophilum (strain DSM 2338 / JCM 9278 / NBRC 100436 / V24Sta) TaxID=444157 RepID=B1YBD3_PYRNV|nr:ketopantoate reductase family protein [Pyrobaculum neutrophilum]ACB39264.1 2-dehydropantoate 2-reductase [Pyrobaculum neutrophilum V24Sta]